MKKLFTFILFLLFCFNAEAQFPSLQYANSIGGDCGGADEAKHITTDASGNVFIIGSFTGKVDFDPSPAIAFLNTYGFTHVYLAKYGPSGNYIWAKEIAASSLGADGVSLALDGSGNIYVTGGFQGTGDFDPSPATATLISSTGSTDIYIAKYDPNGNYIWAKAIGASGADHGNSILIDGTGKVNVTGYFSNATDFDPSLAVATLTSSAGSIDFFLAQYDLNGNYQWAFNFGDSNNDNGFSIACDASNNIFVSGYIMGVADFDPSASTYTLSSSPNGQFCAKYTSSGNFIWVIPVCPNSNGINSIALDASGNVVIGGTFNFTADFDPSASVFNLTSAGLEDGFFAKYDANGNFIWAKAIGGSQKDYLNHVSLSSTGDVLIVGGIEGTSDFDPSAATVNLSPGGTRDGFFAKYDMNGNYIWAEIFNGFLSTSEGWACCFDNSGNTYAAGEFTSSVDFNPLPSMTFLNAVDGNLYFGKYDTNGNYIWAETVEETANGDDVVLSVKNDNSGAVVSTGRYRGVADFNLSSPGTATDTSIWNTYDIFLAKYDVTGNFLWAKSIGGVDDEQGSALALDPSGNIYLTGAYQQTVDFDPSPAVFNLSATFPIQNTFIAKYDMNGNFIWAKSLDGSSYATSNGIALDPMGNLVITGQFYGTVDFDPSISVSNLTAVGADAYFAKYDTNGNLIWANAITGCNSEAVIVNTGGDVILTGQFYSTSDFDPSASTATLTSAGQYDIFLAKYDGNGNYIWAKNIGGTLNENGKALVNDIGGNIYLTGSYKNNCDFDPSVSSFTLSSVGVEDAFVAKYDPNGNFIWAGGFGGVNIDVGTAIGIGSYNNVLVTGHFQKVVDFDPSAGVATYTSSGGQDIFLSQFTTSGIFNWTSVLGGKGDDYCYSMHSNSAGDICTGGSYFDVVDFDYSPITSVLACQGSLDGYVAKYKLLCTCAGINESSAVNEIFNVYPNPASQTVYIESEFAPENIRIIDLNGKIAFEKKSAAFTENINLEKLTAGIYFIEFISERNIISRKKLVIVR